MDASERRRHTRHPIRLPITIRPRDGGDETRSRVADLAEGGVSFESARPFAPGEALELSLPVGDRRFTLVGTVARCAAAASGGFTIGLALVDPQMSFRMKLAEQVLRIQELRRHLSRERGAEVSTEEAARRWVDECARDFADLYAA
jgi:PilZ domain-containing protein